MASMFTSQEAAAGRSALVHVAVVSPGAEGGQGHRAVQQGLAGGVAAHPLRATLKGQKEK